jgi:DNA-binding PadR family transcriptional regulator
VKLTPTHFIVLGLIEQLGEATPYDMKQLVAISLGNFWTVQHAQLYSEPERLAQAGYLSERREQGGRRRRTYTLTAQGREALAAWKDELTADLSELRQPGLLKLFFGSDPSALAAVQLDAHRAKLAEYERMHSELASEMHEGQRLALEAGIELEGAFVRFWERLAGATSGGKP